ncbi:MAG: hypothetical protein QOE06_522 [Thermoleophilaceae bacterium]|nr:hypothetical protein [Thermoleophilaceae bacterium]
MPGSVEGGRAALLLAIVAALAAALYLVPSLGPGSRDQASRTDAPTHHCKHAGEEPSAGLGEADRATLCLLNAERHARGLPALRPNRALRRAALRQSADMVRRRFFEHVNPDGLDSHARIVAAGYRLRAGGFATGENLATGASGADSPAVIVRGWMHSPGHRHNILRPGFEEVGIGIVPRYEEGGAGATYTTTFGGRP